MLSFYLSIKSMLARWSTSLLTISSIAIGVMLLIGVERVREGTRDSFENTVSSIDLIAGARSGPVQLLLYSVFHMGNATNNVGWDSYQKIAANEDVAWTIPLSLGDSHKGYRVVGTTKDYYEHLRFGNDRSLGFKDGTWFENPLDVVLGNEVASKLGYQTGSSIVIAHGVSEVSFQEHSDHPFTVVGVLNRTGTPVDRALFVSLEAIERIHVGWEEGAPPTNPTEFVEGTAPESITAFLIEIGRAHV